MRRYLGFTLWELLCVMSLAGVVLVCWCRHRQELLIPYSHFYHMRLIQVHR